jgi:hypothetical protein
MTLRMPRLEAIGLMARVCRPGVAVLTCVILPGAVLVSLAQQQAQEIAVPFSDPTRVGSLRVSLLNGGLVVKGGDRKDVLVIQRAGGADAQAMTSPNGNVIRGGRRSVEPPAGFRRLTQSSGLVITEEDNQISIRANRAPLPLPLPAAPLAPDVKGPAPAGSAPPLPPSPTTTASLGAVPNGAALEIQVPARVNLRLSTMNRDIAVESADGEIEVTNLNGGITLTNVAGSVVANTHNGVVRVTLTRLTGDKPMAFTSFNGDVDVTLPPTAKANLKMRSDNGDIFTDFDVQIRPSPPQTSSPGTRKRIEVNQSLFGAINGGGPEFELRTFNGNIYVRKGMP